MSQPSSLTFEQLTPFAASSEIVASMSSHTR